MWDAMHTNVECLGWGEVEALGYFQLSDMRYNDWNVVSERVSTTLFNLNTCTNFRTRCRVSEMDLRLPQLLRQSSL